ncbi:MAG: phosphate ABC transporter substrate-binding protein [Eubacteriaceae bacterium]|uniref:Phosphate ABC transporter substrate-binding protein n=1 Tax=Candidatus Pseudoramibacter fermentans TaxID=2594427 RepID=A0A6L5GSU3_9FIRM|nr:phosphate ABC transporter substrate-binding protein [Candidatus Pseudoramibacter fermentans]RRF93021.1 MAG: phosphate ABC transporter substrate-binding protein [Eubacteriaceae bacterium]
MKKKILMVLAAFVAAVTFAGCGSSGGGTINVVSREDGSGTRGAFIELTGVQEEKNGQKVDKTTDKATISNSTEVVMSTVKGDTNAIGYVSLGSLSKDVKAVKVEGVAPSVKTVTDGSYKIQRPFNIMTKGEASGVAQDFINYIMSSDGQNVIEKNGYVKVSTNGAYSGTKPSGKITVGGSSSVTPVMEKLKEAYEKVNPNATIEVQESDSTTGVSNAAKGTLDIGMASRELQGSETSEGLKVTRIAKDGIAIIVNKDNKVDNLTLKQIKNIYTGKTTSWSDVK